jgi:hypothetical protein
VTFSGKRSSSNSSASKASPAPKAHLARLHPAGVLLLLPHPSSSLKAHSTPLLPLGLLPLLQSSSNPKSLGSRSSQPPPPGLLSLPHPSLSPKSSGLQSPSQPNTSCINSTNGVQGASTLIPTSFSAVLSLKPSMASATACFLSTRSILSTRMMSPTSTLVPRYLRKLLHSMTQGTRVKIQTSSGMLSLLSSSLLLPVVNAFPAFSLPVVNLSA